MQMCIYHQEFRGFYSTFQSLVNHKSCLLSYNYNQQSLLSPFLGAPIFKVKCFCQVKSYLLFQADNFLHMI